MGGIENIKGMYQPSSSEINDDGCEQNFHSI
jgi:hypothetical protein